MLCVFAFSANAQELTAEQVLEKSIQFHDPDGKWETFKGTLFITMEIPKEENRDTEIKIDLPNEYFSANAKSGKNTTYYELNKGKCTIKFNGKEPSEEEKKANKLSCERATMYRNYYTYLYGMPMKINDPGAIIHDEVGHDKFMGEMFYTIKVTYKKEVGEDTWYFYFNEETFALEAYQFFHDESKNDGEYIMFSGLETIGGIKMPKTRDWYYNSNGKHLGTDILKTSF